MNRNQYIVVTDRDFALLRTLRHHAQLVAELERAEVVEARDVPPDVVTMNSRVRFQDLTTGETKEVTIVFPHDADIDNARVSVLAPVGTALLGLAQGDSIVWPFPDGGSRCLKVLAVTFQPEAEADRSTAG